jgi:hypothetical protein
VATPFVGTVIDDVYFQMLRLAEIFVSHVRCSRGATHRMRLCIHARHGLELLARSAS